MNIALIGNPNAGKTSLFNQLTGLNQKVANFSGVTIEKKTGSFVLQNEQKVFVTDLPGTYSLYPKSADEQVVLDFLLNPVTGNILDLLIVVVDASNLQRNLLLFSEAKDLGIPCILVFNMMDIAEQSGWHIDILGLEHSLQTKIVSTNARNGQGIKELKAQIGEENYSIENKKLAITTPFLPVLDEIRQKYNLKNVYCAYLYLQHYERLSFLKEEEKKYLQKIQLEQKFNSLSLQAQETLERYNFIGSVVAQSIQKYEKSNSPLEITQKIDRILMHKVGGYGIFVALLLLMFVAIFKWAEAPMELIESATLALQNFLRTSLPIHFFTDFLTDGLIAGLGSVLVFVPQIALLFLFIAILEESGYMVRVMIIMDKLMRRFGLNGKSVVPMISGVACAIPAIMAARNIDNTKERLITILVTPLISCSARLPIYTIMIGLVVPASNAFWIVSWRAIALLFMYFLGFFMALLASIILNKILKQKDESYFVVEMPTYKMPRWRNIAIVIISKLKAFIWEAGRVIIFISVILWFLASFGWGDSLQKAEQSVRLKHPNIPENQIQSLISAAKLEASFAGDLGKIIEPVIAPLGFDWKMGICLIASFSAREVFVSTMSIIYGLSGDDEQGVRKQMAQEINPDTGKPVYGVAVGFSLMIFYAFAMQCMSTVAIVYKETKSLKYTLIQLISFNILAYIAAFLVYQTLK